MGFTQSYSGVSVDIGGLIQLIPSTCRSEKPIKITGIDKVHSKDDCVNGSIVNSVQGHIWYSLALDKPPLRETYKEFGIKLFNKTNKSVLSHITFYFEDDDHKAVDFNGETISFTCQLYQKE